MTSLLSFDQLGIQLDAHVPLRSMPAVGIYGASGSGKSTEMLVAFAQYNPLVVKISESVSRPYYSWQREQDRPTYDRARHEFVAANAAHTAHSDFDRYADQWGLDAVMRTTGWPSRLQEVTIPDGVSWWSWMTQLRDMTIGARRAGWTLPYSGLIVDEFTEVLRVVYLEMQRSGMFMSKKKRDVVDDFAVMDALEEWMRDFIGSFRRAKMLLGCVCQEAPLSYDEDKESRFFGQVKYKCGPATPIGRLRSVITQAMDAMVRITLAPGGALVTGPAMPTAVPQPSVTPSTPRAPSPIISPASVPGGFELASGSAALLSEWPLAPKMLKGWSKRMYWTEARPDVEAKFRDVRINWQEELGFLRLLKIAGYL